ncbi:hypothetical protein P2H44_20700 [Albimonas sp. CAU 1670]|uniref:hypothetical protein n=1 Tax=Albimonas sp. CAU 1670 TaxID=3032599 RepID=UPI0023DA0344|nr:hypothetical protein [Albimonas sp. CAU 1670]MDF2234987.1 hypothetical protein [Albimonas sp. CAU 1670]
MFLELIATIVAGVGAAGLVLLLNRTLGGRLPRWAAPLAAGAAMIAATVWSEYDWAGRTVAALPEGLVVVEEVQETAWYRPWTYVVPLTTRLAALDVARLRSHPDAPGVKLGEVYLFGRWRPAGRAPQLIRCAPAARAEVTDAALSDPAAAAWRPVDPADPMVAAACAAPQTETGKGAARGAGAEAASDA